MPFVNGVYQSNSASPMERLYGMQKRAAELAEMQRQQDMMRERQKILAEAYSPAQEEVKAIQAQQFADPMAQPNDALGVGVGAGLASAFGIAPQQEQAPSFSGIAGKPAEFDKETAIKRLYGIGDTETASALINDDYKSALSGEAGSGAKGYYGTDYTPSDRPGFVHPVQYDRNGGAVVNKEVYLPEKLTYRDLGSQDVAIGAGGEIRGRWNKDLTPAQQKEYDAEYQAFLEFRKSKAREEGQAAGQKEAGVIDKVEKAGEAITELASMVDSLKMLPQSAAGMKWEGLTSFFTGGDPKIQEALGNIDRISGRMLEYANKLPGAATDADRVLFMSSAGVMNDPDATPARKIAAAQSAIGAYQRLMAKYGARPSAASGPAPATKPPAQARAPASVPAARPMPSLPNPAQHKGRIVRDTKTGIRYQSNGSQWMRVK